MYLCYLDESGTPDHSSNTGHFTLLGITIPVDCWQTASKSINEIKSRFGLDHAEIHTGWMMRRYQAQENIPKFADLDRSARRQETEMEWQTMLRSGQISMTAKGVRNEKIRYNKSRPYFHLTYDDRVDFLRAICDTLDSMSFVRIFAESIDKTSCPAKTEGQIVEQSFMQVVTRFDYYLEAMSRVKNYKQ